MTMVLSGYFTRVYAVVVTILVALAPMASRAEVIFEGYYKLLSAGMHAGYVVQRYETDKNTITCTYFLRSNALGNDVTESLVAKSNLKFEPISYQYTSNTKAGLKTIDAEFNGNKMKVSVSDGKQTKSDTLIVPDKVFLSSFVGYLMLNNGLKKGKRFKYQAIAEEDADAYNGDAEVTGDAKINDLNVFRIKNTFKGVSFISFVNDKGEVIATKSPQLQISTELVKTQAEATKGISFPVKTIKTLFGNIPVGNKNALFSAPAITVTTDKKTDSKVMSPKEKSDAKTSSPSDKAEADAQ